ncbi:hypothetical protein [Mucilaginibacter sp.]|uniref:hypothetical protein n=1 Tax=Mucilaginibacter sp. TaxID=1882438 RepID=UPI0035BBF397
MMKYYTLLSNTGSVIKKPLLQDLLPFQPDATLVFEETLFRTRIFYHAIDEFKYRMINFHGNDVMLDLKHFTIQSIDVDEKMGQVLQEMLSSKKFEVKNL